MRKLVNNALAGMIVLSLACAPKVRIITTTASLTPAVKNEQVTYENALHEARIQLANFCSKYKFEDALLITGSGQIFDIGSNAKSKYLTGRNVRDRIISLSAELDVRKIFETAKNEEYLKVMHCHPGLNKDSFYTASLPSTDDIRSAIMLSFDFYAIQPNGKISFEVVHLVKPGEIHSTSYLPKSEVFEGMANKRKELEGIVQNLQKEFNEEKDEQKRKSLEMALAIMPVGANLNAVHVANAYAFKYNESLFSGIKIDASTRKRFEKDKIGLDKYVAELIIQNASQAGPITLSGLIVYTK